MTTLAALELEQRRRRLAFEAHETVRIVLEHEQVVRLRDLDDAAAALLRERPAAGVLEGGDRVEEHRLLALGERLLERFGIEPFVVHRERHDLRAETREDLQRPVVRRRLDEARGSPA